MSTPEGDRPFFSADPHAAGGAGETGPIPPIPHVPTYGAPGFPVQGSPDHDVPIGQPAQPQYERPQYEQPQYEQPQYEQPPYEAPAAGQPVAGIPEDDMPRRPTQRRMVRRAPEEVPDTPVDHSPEVGKPSAWLREVPILIAVALAIALLVKTFLVQAFFIPSESMENTLLVGDRVLVNKFSARFGGDVGRGQVIVFKDPGGWLDEGQDDTTGNPVVKKLKDVFSFVGLLPSQSEKDLIKRVIGVAGDKVVCCDDKGRITVNGVPLDEPYLYPGDKPSDRQFSVTVPPNRLWVMGDHRSDSADSRSHMDGPGNGTIPTDNVVGRAFISVWPINRAKLLRVPDTFKRPEIDTGGLAPSASAIGLGVLGPVMVLRRRRFHQLQEQDRG